MGWAEPTRSVHSRRTQIVLLGWQPSRSEWVSTTTSTQGWHGKSREPTWLTRRRPQRPQIPADSPRSPMAPPSSQPSSAGVPMRHLNGPGLIPRGLAKAPAWKMRANRHPTRGRWVALSWQHALTAFNPATDSLRRPTDQMSSIYAQGGVPVHNWLRLACRVERA